MGLLEKISLARQGKAFSEPPFWSSIDSYPFTASYSREYETIENDFASYVMSALKGSGPVFAAIDRRQQVFSQARFLWRRFRNGRPGDLFPTAELSLLEKPWPNGTTGELLARMEVDVSLAGNFYATTVDNAGKIGQAATGPGRRIARMRPDWVRLVLDAPSGNPYGVDTRVVAYQYRTPDSGMMADPLVLLPTEVVHYSPIPDPAARFRGMSWLTPVLREVMADTAATEHKLRFFSNGSSPSMALKFPPGTSKAYLQEFKKQYETEYRGSAKAYRTLFLAGADPVPLSMDLKQLDFKATQGAGETRIAAASGVPAAILGISEGLAGSSLNAGNFGAARRLFVDTTIRDLWAKAAPSLEILLTSPGSDARLWVDDRDIPFLREDAADNAAIQAQEAATIRQLLDGGCVFASIVAAVTARDWTLLQHSGQLSVQLQDPLTTNGSANGRQAVRAG